MARRTVEQAAGVSMDPRPVFIRGAYSYDTDFASNESAISCLDESYTLQSEAEEADINTIVRRFGLTGQVPENVPRPTITDFVDVFDFQSAQNALIAAEKSFMEMPAAVRRRFSNDPHEFVAFCSDERNLPEMRKMGLAVPEKVPDPVPEPMLVRVVPDTEAKPK